MFDPAHNALLPAREVARATSLIPARNGLRWASYGFTEVPADTLEHIVEAVPPSLASALQARAYYFVPLAIGEPQSSFQATSQSGSPITGAAGTDTDTEIAPGFSDELSDRATCHRTLVANGVESTFISARLMQDKFALAFEFFINIGHQFVDANPVPDRFQALLWSQVRADVRGETSQDAYETRKRAAESAATNPAIELGTTPSTSPSQDSADNQSAPATANPGLESPFGYPDTAAERPESPLPIHEPNATGNPPHTRADFGLALTRAAAGTSAGMATTPAGATAGTTPSIFAFSESKPARRGAVAAKSTPALPQDTPADPARTAFFEAAFADTLAIYMLSLTLDLDYADLREREYPLLAAPALADRLRLVADLYPPPVTYEFAIRYRRRH